MPRPWPRSVRRSKRMLCSPERINVEFVTVRDRIPHLRMRVWERGAGITLACGTGACAAAVAAHRRGLTDRRVEVLLDGGALTIEWRESDGHMLMTGPATLSFRGEIDLAALSHERGDRHLRLPPERL